MQLNGGVLPQVTAGGQVSHHDFSSLRALY
jgi:hypothetical protein